MSYKGCSIHIKRQHAVKVLFEISLKSHYVNSRSTTTVAGPTIFYRLKTESCTVETFVRWMMQTDERRKKKYVIEIQNKTIKLSKIAAKVSNIFYLKLTLGQGINWLSQVGGLNVTQINCHTQASEEILKHTLSTLQSTFA